MINIGMNLDIIAARTLVNEDQEERLMIKHGWTQNKFAVGIVDGAFVRYNLGQGLSSVWDDIDVIEPYNPLEGDITALWDVYKVA